MSKVQLIVHGKVQGVGFRFSVVLLATSMENIFGRVWNNEDGTVGIEAQCEDPLKLKKFINEVKKGPSPYSKVSHVDINPGAFNDYHNFKEK